jgi:small conductance mechanosensitive channel
MDIDITKLIEQLQGYAVVYGLKILGALAILFIGKIVVNMLVNVTCNILKNKKIDETVVGFINSLSKSLLMIVLVLAALDVVGVQTTSMVAILGAAGLAIGLALQGSLSNFGAGVLLVIFRPIRVGDFIEAAGTMGTVEEIGIFTTNLTTPDNKVVIMPNAGITSGNIINYSIKDMRRIDFVFGVSYSADLSKVREIFEKILKECDYILEDPAYTIGVLELGDSSVNFAVRPWVKTKDYWNAYFYLTEKAKRELDLAGIEIPFPQTDIHLHKDEN